MSWYSKYLTPFLMASKHPVESFIRLESTQDETTIIAEDGSLVSYIKVDGSRQIIGDEEYKFLIEAATVKLGSRFDKPGHALQIFFSRNPQRMRREMEKLTSSSKEATQNIGLELDDLIDEKKRHLSRFLVQEDNYYVLWTRPSSMTKPELERAAKLAKKKAKYNVGEAQSPETGLEGLQTRHTTYVTGFLSALDEMGIRADLLEVHDALAAVRTCMFPSRANDGWRACVPGDPIPPRAPRSATDMADILWPPLRTQLAVSAAEKVSNQFIEMDNMLWGGCDLTLAPMDPSPFPMLMNRLFESGIPFRISYLIESGGIQGATTKASIASILAVTNSQNKQIQNSINSLAAVARSEPVVRMRVSLATWAPKGNTELMEDRISILMQAVESWGYCQVSNMIGDPLDAIMSSSMGIACASTAPAAIAPLYEVFKLIPWQRPSSPFDKGSIILRSPDGKVWPYQTGSSMTNTWFDLIFAQPGAGKSVLMNTLNLGTCMGAGLSKLPYVAIIDIGPSSSGLISLIKEALPPERKHEAAYYRLQMSSEYAINPFDTQLGCRYPLADERAYLIELLTLLCTPAGKEEPYDGIQQLAGMVVDEMYRWRDDTKAGAEARPYLPRIDEEVDEALRKHNVHLPKDPYWWDVVDKFFELGQYHLANLAQRHAVPVLADSIVAARRPQIRSLLEETSIGASVENVVNAFERMITSAIREFPIVSAVTKFEITDARVCSLDLMDVAPQGDATADRQTAIMYMLARHALVRSWWMAKENLEFIPEKYRHYHELKLQDLAETPKRLCYDEFHRTSKSPAVRTQVVRDVREGRKRSVQIVLSSQLIDDFSDDMVDLATGVWILGTAISESAIDRAQERFGLSDTARNIIRYQLTGPRSGGAPCLFVLGSKDGRYEQHLINTLGPIELWALSTSTEDVGVRNRLYARLGAQRARRALAASFPGGSASAEIKRRLYLKAEGGKTGAAVTSEVIDEIVNELVDLVMKAEARIERAS
ncbi:MAG: type IV secretion protein IcmB [Micavibrio sp.]|nr:type IV secretion protein IcmB [Micavibrio sp.]